MRMKTKHGFRRALAFALTLVMLLGMAPYAAASEETLSYSYSLTVTVKGVNGESLTGANVKISGGSLTGKETATTGNDGKVTFTGYDWGTGGGVAEVTVSVTNAAALGYTEDNTSTTVEVTSGTSAEAEIQLKVGDSYVKGAFIANQIGYNNGNEIKLLEQKYELSGTTVTYSLANDKNEEIKLSDDTKIPTATDVGKYTVTVKVAVNEGTKGYGATTYTNQYTAEITQSNIKIIHYNQENIGDRKDGRITKTGGELYQEYSLSEASADFGAYLDAGVPKELKEQLKITYGTAGTDSHEASNGLVINAEDGKVTWNNKYNGEDVKTPEGLYTFTAEVTGDKAANYTDEAKKTQCILVLYKESSETDPLLKFDKENIEYTLYSDAVPSQSAEKTYGEKDNGEVTYSIEPANSGINCNASDGILTVDTTKLLAMVKAAESETGCAYTVTAKKAAGTKDGHTLYGEATASYTLVIKPAEIADAEAAKAAYTVSTTKSEGSDWYNSDVTVTAKDGYSLADTKADTTTYGKKVTLTESGETQDIYINDKTAKKAYSKYTITDIKIDKDLPAEFDIVYSGATWVGKVKQVLTLGIAPAGLTVTLTAKDDLSGVASFTWWFVGTSGLKYTVDGDTEKHSVPTVSSETDVPAEPATIKVNDEQEKGTFSCKFELTGDSVVLAALKQYKGAIKAKVSDYAGNVKDKYDRITVYKNSDEDGQTGDANVIIDKTSPVISNVVVPEAKVEDAENKIGYYDDDVTVSFKLTEENIESSDVVLTVTKDGTEMETPPAITWTAVSVPKADSSEEEEKATEVKPESNEPTPGAADGTVYTGQFTLPKDGEYKFTINATDKAGNKADEYVYDGTIIIDATEPEAELEFKVSDTTGKTLGGKQYTKGDVTYTVTIKDNFFKRDSVTVTGTHIKPDGTTENFTKPFAGTDFDGQDGNYTASFTLDKELENIEGEYNLTVEYKDYLGRDLEKVTLPENHPVIDVTAPEFSVEYEPVRTNENEGYFKDKSRTATIKVTEANFDETVDAATVKNKMITATDVTDTDIKDGVKDKITADAWKVDAADETKRSMTVTFEGEANYNFDILAKEESESGKEVAVFKDLAGNEAVVAKEYETYEEDKTFTIDWTAPNAKAGAPGTVLVSYNIEDANKGKTDSKGWIDSIIGGIRFGFWNKDKDTDKEIEVTITVEDAVAGVDGGTFVYARAKTVTKDNKTVYVSDKNAASLEGTFELRQVMDGDKKTSTFTGTILLPKSEIDKATEQLNGTLVVTVKDRCGNAATGEDDSTRIVYDTISPTAKVALSGVVNTEGDTKFFNSQIGVGISLVESNFFEDTVKATVNDNQVGIKWKSTDADNHQGTFSLTSDGDYLVKITGMDYAGNGMNAYESGKLVLDTKIEAPEIQINGAPCDGCAYKDDAVLTISFFDTNYSGVNIKILRTRLGEKDVDVTEKFLVGKLDTDAEGGMAYIDTFTKTQDNDGIYTVIATVSDKATNSASATATFTLNRFGSVYEYGSYLRELIKNGGKYVKGITQDLTLTEYNADKLIDGSMKVEITKDGKLISNPIFTVRQIKANETDKTVKNDRGEKGWYEYVYTISKDNFKEDGFYKIVVSSRDAAGNRPENSNYKGMEIQFHVDSVPPELTGVTGLEKAILNAERVDVKYTAYDTVGLKSIKVYVNGELYEEITNFSADPNNYNGVITILESTRAQSVRIVIEDLAGNITDTDAEGFTSAYKMVKSILVSTSFFARFYGNKPLFWGTVGGVLFLAAFTGIFIPFMKKRKEKKEEEETAAHLR